MSPPPKSASNPSPQTISTFVHVPLSGGTCWGLFYTAIFKRRMCSKAHTSSGTKRAFFLSRAECFASVCQRVSTCVSVRIKGGSFEAPIWFLWSRIWRRCASFDDSRRLWNCVIVRFCPPIPSPARPIAPLCLGTSHRRHGTRLRGLRRRKLFWRRRWCCRCGCRRFSKVLFALIHQPYPLNYRPPPPPLCESPCQSNSRCCFRNFSGRGIWRFLFLVVH